MTENVLPADGVPPSAIPVEQHPIVLAAIASLKAFGSMQMDRENAALILPMWAHYWELSEREISAVYEYFTPDDDEESTADPEAPVAHPGGGWISGPMIGGGR
jgi:hypothetical protein